MKKINSEVKIDSPFFKSKWGTIDKKNPSIIYLEIGTYISPSKESDYSSAIKTIEKNMKSIVGNRIYLSHGDYKPNFIFTTDVADSRISPGKKSYMTFQLHLQLAPQYMQSYKDSGGNFKCLINDLSEKWNPFYGELYNEIESNGFNCSKTKN